MERLDLNRRDFTRLTLAAFGGAMAGAMSGCSADKPVTPTPTPTTGTTPADTGAAAAGPENFAMGDQHLCRGLNTCKDKDKDGSNACAGQGDCATFEASCSGSNECKGLGGCGDTVGINACKSKGGCHVPLMDEAWTKVRKVFEERMTADGKAFGEAPAAAGS